MKWITKADVKGKGAEMQYFPSNRRKSSSKKPGEVLINTPENS